MNREPVSKSDRRDAVRALLVSLADDSADRPAGEHVGARGRWSWVRPVAATAIAAVFALVVYFGLTAVHTGAIVPGIHPRVSESPAAHMKPVKAGAVIGSWSSDAAPVSYGGTVDSGGLAIATTVTCTGSGSLAISISHVSDTDGSCAGKPQTSRGSGGVTEPVTVKIRPHGGTATWKVVLRAVAPTTFTPKPVRATDGAGRPVPYCTGAQLGTKYVHVPEPLGVTGTTDGEIILTNTSSRQCAVSGYPTVTFVDASGTPVGHHANKRTDSRSYATRAVLAPVLLSPGGHAYLQLSSGHADRLESCRPVTSTSLRFSSTNDGFSAPVAFTATIPTTRACSNPTVLQLFATLYVAYPADLRTPAQITKAATCTLDELAIALRPTPDQAGEHTGAIGFTNTGKRSCHLNGTPALVFLKDDGTPAGRHTGVQLHGGDPDLLDDGYTVLGRGDTLYVHFAIQPAAAITGCRPTTVHRLRTTTGEFGYSTTITLPDTERACTDASVTQLRATGFISEKDYSLVSLPEG